jgi:hypothetical protein
MVALAALDGVTANGGNLLDEVLAGRVVPTVDGVRMVGHASDLARDDPEQGRGIYLPDARKAPPPSSPAG